jgi:hypothetical protein
LVTRTFMVANHVSLRAGAYRPRSTEDRQLIAVELAYVVQQSQSGPASRQGQDSRRGFGGRP